MSRPLPAAPRALLWDLDGTLVDTGHDLATAINGMLVEYGLPALPAEQVAGHVGKGARNLVTRCLEDVGQRDRSFDQITRALAVFERHYDQHLLDTTRPFPGVVELFQALEPAGIPNALVSNKPEGFCRQITDALGLGRYFPVVVGGETLPSRKPDPAPLLHALAQLRPSDWVGGDLRAGSGEPGAIAPSEAIMIGDTPIDTEAAERAGIACIAVTWGFASRTLLQTTTATHVVDTPDELARLLLR
ncbi:MAG: HAD hydrolase-like protein [Candidatus Eisenbacteria bacterium]|nr:HAD hydrolase-like protein [Candidatus Eisenbacteria bacterium]